MDVVLELIQALVAPDLGVAVCIHEAEHHGTKRRVVLGILRWEDELLNRHILGVLVTA